jgi:hypothetical protein
VAGMGAYIGCRHIVVTRTEAQAIVKELTKSIDVIGLVVGLKFLATPNDEDISCRLW